ncbi:Carbamoyl-phosphate synthase [Mycena chlorophos]|uniref:Ammonium-dependent carbamoyl phosphate synthetase n=1 Tax=Mycena chlorophos TaxID=658473 RepID=A0A8H6SEH7_MYCCL|nr:Carbamoyl-phosphate synthase [Mycena chlorophos]
MFASVGRRLLRLQSATARIPARAFHCAPTLRAVAAPAVGAYDPNEGEHVLNSPSELARRISAKVLPKVPRPDVQKVVMVGSGGLSIGQAGEFDYSGSQALKALSEEGVSAVLINPNIATWQTSHQLASEVYFLPITADYVAYVLEKERPDGILLTFGGQSALNVGIELDRMGVLERLGVKVLGTPIRTLEVSEDRDLFVQALKALSRPTDMRLFAIAYAMYNKNYTVDQVHDLTKIDKWFLYKIDNIVQTHHALKAAGSVENIDHELMQRAKRMGFADVQIADLVSSTEDINIALRLKTSGVTVLGTDPAQIDTAEDRHKFSSVLDSIGVDQPEWTEVTTLDAAKAFAAKVQYPVLIRPSYVLSGAAMNVVYEESALEYNLSAAASVSPLHPVVITKFIDGAQEIDVDAVAHKGQLLVHAVSEHVENAGVHSGDATLVLPPFSLSSDDLARLKTIAEKVASAFEISGPFNMQIIKKPAEGNEVPQLKVIECNLRASRSFPFVSKVLGHNFIDTATKAIVGQDVPQPVDIMSEARDYTSIKVAQFSWTRLGGADPFLGVEMASTGEVASFGKDVYEAYWASLLSTTGFKVPKANSGILLGGDLTTPEMPTIAKRLVDLGFKLYCSSPEVEEFLNDVQYVSAKRIFFPTKDKRKLREVFDEYDISCVINLAKTRGTSFTDEDYVARRNAVDFGLPLLNNARTADLFVESLARKIPQGGLRKYTEGRIPSELALDNVSSPRTTSQVRTSALQTLERILATSFVPSSCSGEMDYLLALQYTFECNIPSRLLSWIASCTRRLENLTARGVNEGDDAEVATLSSQLEMSLGIIQGVCLTHPTSKIYLGRKYSQEVLLELFLAARYLPFPSTPNAPIANSPAAAAPRPLAWVILETLLCILVDSSPALRVFEECEGLHAIVRILKRAETPREVRMKCFEFLYFYLLDETAPSPSNAEPAAKASEPTPVPTAPSTPVPTASSTPMPTPAKKKPFINATPSRPMSHYGSSTFAFTSSSFATTDESSTSSSSSSSSSRSTSGSSSSSFSSTSSNMGSTSPKKHSQMLPSVGTPRQPQSRALMMLKKDVDFVPLSPKKPLDSPRGTPMRSHQRTHTRTRSQLASAPSVSSEDDHSTAVAPSIDERKSTSSSDAETLRGGESNDMGCAKTTEEKKKLLSTMLGNVDALVDSVRKVSIWGLA